MKFDFSLSGREVSRIVGKHGKIEKIQNLFVVLFLFSNEMKGCQEKSEYTENWQKKISSLEERCQE